MLDVHPPHHPVQAWRDFLVHIATIVVGLLIAVGIEQTVEFFHHRHQIHQAREQIRIEVETNLHWQRDINDAGLNEIAARMARNIAILRLAEKGAAPPDAQLDFTWKLQGFNDGAYRAARENGAVALMLYEEAETYSDLYTQQQIFNEAALALIAQIKTAQGMTLRGHSVTQMTPAELQELLAATSGVQGKLVALREWSAEFKDEAAITLKKTFIER